MMSRRIVAASTVVALLMSGCAATVDKQQASAIPLQAPAAAAASKHLMLLVQAAPGMVPNGNWDALRSDWRESAGMSAGRVGMAYTWLDTGKESTSRQAVLAVVKVKNYRYISATERVGLGMLGGDGYLNTEVTFYEMPDKRLLGTRAYSTSTKAIEGVFSAATRKQIEAMSQEIVSEVHR